MHQQIIIIPLAIAFTMCACSSDNGNEETPPQQEEIAINIQPVADSGMSFEQGDAIGLFAGSQSINVQFIYNDFSWKPTTKAYWKDSTTRTNLYLYSPYNSSATDASSLSFKVASDQSNKVDFKNSDLVAGIASNQAPTSSTVAIPLHHMMSLVKITVVPGKGVAAQDISIEKLKVSINGVRTNANVDITKSEVAPTGDTTTITPYYNSNDKTYEAVVVPQSVSKGSLITVSTVLGDFNLQDSPSFKSGQTYSYTMTIDKYSSSFDVSISSWDTDDKDYGGTAE